VISEFLIKKKTIYIRWNKWARKHKHWENKTKKNRRFPCT